MILLYIKVLWLFLRKKNHLNSINMKNINVRLKVLVTSQGHKQNNIVSVGIGVQGDPEGLENIRRRIFSVTSYSHGKVHTRLVKMLRNAKGSH